MPRIMLAKIWKPFPTCRATMHGSCNIFPDTCAATPLKSALKIGNVAAHYLPQVDHALLVEPAINLFTQLQMRFSGDNRVTTACALLKDVDQSLLVKPFDAAIMVNVLEHIDDDLAVLADLHRLVKPGGALLLLFPRCLFCLAVWMNLCTTSGVIP